MSSLHPSSWERIQEFESYKPMRSQVEEVEYPVPRFTSHMTNLELKEGDTAHFECTVEPTRDPTMTFELLHNGQPVPSGSRYAITHDFGYVTLDIAYVYPEDSGVYTCIVSNCEGQAVSTAALKVHGFGTIDTSILHPMGKEGLRRIQELESQYRMPARPEARQDFPKPCFVQPLEQSFTVNESQGLHLECRVEPSNDPNLVIEWLLNGETLTIGSRFSITTDFGYIVMDIHDLWPRDSGIYTCKLVT
jgi:titin